MRAAKTLVAGGKNALPGLRTGLPTVLAQVQANMQSYPDCVLLTKVGGFYELYFQHAEELHRPLGLRRSYRDTRAGPVAMAGFPFFQLDRYLKLIVGDMGKRVAVSEEHARLGIDGRRLTGNLFDRKVTRIVTPGTLSSHLTDEHYHRPDINDFVLACRARDGQVDLAWLDVATADYFVQSCERGDLLSAIHRISPKEIVTTFDLDFRGCPVTRVPDGDGVCAVLLQHVSLHDGQTKLDLQPKQYDEARYVKLDGAALQSLELLRTIRTGFLTGTLLHALKRPVVTQAGARSLAERLTAPLRDVVEIDARLDLVEVFTRDETLASDVELLLREAGDMARIVQRFSFGRGSADDLLVVAQTVELAQRLVALVPVMQHRVDALSKVVKKIRSSIDEAGLASSRHREAAMAEEALEQVGAALDRVVIKPKTDDARIFTMRRNATPALADLHASLEESYEQRSLLETQLRADFAIPSLTLKSAPTGHFVYVRKGEVPGARLISSTRSTRTYALDSWTDLGGRIDSLHARIIAEEDRAFRALRLLVLSHAAEVRENAAVIAEIDVSLALARTAVEYGWTRPIVDDSRVTHIVGGRHPIVEGRGAVELNDCTLDEHNCMLVTGPNMGGKSTYLRQVCLIQILGQMGSFVPAAHARLGCVDAIYSRVGSSDNLYEDESTFMCEMKETASILGHATDRSLVVMDEVGRGTTTRDGLAISRAVLHDLHDRVRCRTLFATHFHELADMATDHDRLATVCTSLEYDGDWHFSRQMRSGVCTDSHGVECARMAGLPADVLDHAARHLSPSAPSSSR